ncbi:MAG TPA: hypothetical protein PLD20_18630 [Blastocatellia bacterium]|nr:hypothetical protein [Blastocatellia bacterium]HMX25778.1 hypothetical protein [Blastocatellia bacterium]HMY71637.1 hypothetical protein [Blastocatellia bacterium]HMZ19960.1 hypothetical protein [Blastocatellia bacterium]HNG32774.1 hypothetical protein [Blastocatellia bacterium]
MARDDIRVNKAREDKAVNGLVDNLIATGGFNVIFPLPDQLFQGLQQLIQADIEDGEEARRNRGQSSEFESEDEKSIYTEQLTQCVWQHFYQHRAEKFRFALVELIHESLGFSWSIHRERSGFGVEEINEARPTMSDLQQNVLRHSLRRLRSLPVRKERETESAENDSQLHPFLRAAYEIQNNLSVWTYNHVRVYELLREALYTASTTNGHSAEDADDLSHGLANEMAELIWENVEESVGLMIKVMLSVMTVVALPSFAQQNAIDDPEIEEHKHSAGKLKEKIIDPLIDAWLKNFLPLLRTPGGSQPLAQVSDDDCIEYVRRYGKLLPILQEASTVYKEITTEEGRVDYHREEALTEIRMRYSAQLTEDVIRHIPHDFPSTIALFAASKGLNMQGYSKRKLQDFRKRGRDLLKKEVGTS